MSLTQVFEQVLEKPELYIVNKSVTRLVSFIEGYKMALYDLDQSTNSEIYLGFQDWVAQRFNTQTSHNWASIILFRSLNDESKALDMTKELWHEYKRERQIKL